MSYSLYVLENNDEETKLKVDEFNSLHDAQKAKSKFELTKQRHVQAHDELYYHYKNLSWKIED